MLKESQQFFRIDEGNGSVIAASIHSGHAVRHEISELLALDEKTRLREEDPFTDTWTSIGDTRITCLTSRFEVDLNRPRDKAVYTSSEDAWGLRVWKKPVDIQVINKSLMGYDHFYNATKNLLTRLTELHGRLIVYDLHSYNHRRDGQDAPPADPNHNPEINLGTKTMDRSRWAPIVERFIQDLRNFNFQGRHLDVRENVKFYGGYFPTWIHSTFSESICTLSIDVKKFFMDEWTGDLYVDRLESIYKALISTVPGVLEELHKL